MRRYIKLFIIACLIGVFGFWIYLNREKGNPVENFEYFFKTFKKNYALFEVKDVDWDKIYNYYSEKVDENTTDDELFEIFHESLKRLDDKHCYIYRFNEIYFSGFDLPSQNYLDLLSFDFREDTDDFSLKLIEKEYLKSGFNKSMQIYSLLPPVGIRNVFTAGWLTDSIAYLHMSEMSNKGDKVHQAIDEIFQKYGSANGFVIDLRDNIGGYSIPVKRLAGKFTDKERVFAISRLRQADSMNSFKEPDYWKIQPTSGKLYNSKPVAVLTNRNTQSAAELFTLMIRSLPNVTLIGDTTTGIFADTHIGKLPNGWEYRLSIRKTSDKNDKCLEDIGIAPDILVINTKQEIENGKDKVIEYAMKDIINRK